jgi:hypothetical protein
MRKRLLSKRSPSPIVTRTISYVNIKTQQLNSPSALLAYALHILDTFD